MEKSKNETYIKKYYKQNKDKWNTYKDCPCGSKYCSNTRTNHFNSRKHKLYESQEKIKELEIELKNIKCV